MAKENLNLGGHLHGGFTAFVVDSMNTYALMANGANAGVTVDLNIRYKENYICFKMSTEFSFLSYLRSASEGDEVIVVAEPIRVGRNLAFLECHLKHKKDGSLIAKASQTNFIG